MVANIADIRVGSYINLGSLMEQGTLFSLVGLLLFWLWLQGA